jgi:predicted ferric reductase
VNDFWWFVSRATGIVATALAVAALVFGFFFSSRNTGRRRPAWWLDLHNWLGGAALAFTVVHVVTIYLDENAAIGLLAALVPGAATDQSWAITWGVIAMYSFAITVFTSWPRKRLRRTTWRVVHLTSVAGTVLAGLHAFQIGTDATAFAFEAALVAATALLVYAALVRAIALVMRRAE